MHLVAVAVAVAVLGMGTCTCTTPAAAGRDGLTDVTITLFYYNSIILILIVSGIYGSSVFVCALALLLQ